MRDIVQNHVMQVLCLTAMEPPVTFDAESVREEKVKVLKAVRPIPEDEVEDYAVRGQYERGWVWGEEVPGYREEKNVDPESVTETFVALKVFVDNWRWARVPFYIRAGKRLPKKATEVAIQFHSSPHTPFAHDDTEGLAPNVLVVRVQPDELSLKIGAKVPGTGFEVSSVNMDLLYGTAFLEEAPDAYQRLLLDLMLGDPTLFIRADEAEGAWRILDPVMRHWSQKREVSFYPAGTWGPEEADALLERDGREGGRDRGDAPGTGGGRMSVGQIERELGKLRTNDDGTLALRSSVLNLIVVTDEVGTGDHRLGLEAGGPPPSAGRGVYRRPRGRTERGRGLSAFCNVRGGSSAQVCAEQVTIHAEGPAARHLESFAGPLLIPDLPVFLWYPGGFSPRSQEFAAMADLADRVIVDSAASENHEACLREIAALIEDPEMPAIGDLQWVGLSPWRSLLADTFGAPERAGDLEKIERAEILYAPGGENRALLFAGWLASTLGWKPESGMVAARTLSSPVPRVGSPSCSPPIHRG